MWMLYEILPGENRSRNLLDRPARAREEDGVGWRDQSAGGAGDPLDEAWGSGVHLSFRRRVGSGGAGGGAVGRARRSEESEVGGCGLRVFGAAGSAGDAGGDQG